MPHPTVPSSRDTSPSAKHPSLQDRKRQWRLREDYRGRLPLSISRYLGYRPPGATPPYAPTYLFSFLRHIPLKWEVAIFATFAAFISILLVEAVAHPSSSFPDALHDQLVIASFGASAVLIYSAIESPLSQPRNLVGGQVISAIIGVAITRLFARDASYTPSLTENGFFVRPFFNGGLCMSLALFAMFVTGTLHPPGGATALIAATSKPSAEMSWKFIPAILVCSLVMLGWACIINNLGRRRYPIYWWSPERTFVVDEAPAPREDEEIALGSGEDNVLRQAEDGGRTAEAMSQQVISRDSPEAIHRAMSKASADSSAYRQKDRRSSIS